MSHGLFGLSLAVGLSLGMLALLEVGRRIGRRRAADDPERVTAGFGAVDGAVFGLMGLLLAFTFSGAAARFDTRRELIVEEANDIGTAYLRLDLLPSNAQPPLRDLFRRYLDSRLATYRRLPDLAAAREELARSEALQGEIWSRAVATCRAEGSPATTTLVLSALNEMIDIATTRTAAAMMHPPAVVFVLLCGLALGSSLLAGYDMGAGRARSWLHMIGFAFVISLAVYVILDLEFPRLGLIRVEAFDQVLVDLGRRIQ